MVIEVPDIRFKVCPDLLGRAVGDGYPYSREIDLQVVLSGAVLTIEVIGAVFVCVAGVFRGCPVHDVATAVGIPSLVLATLLLSWSFRDAAGWQLIHPATFLIAVGMFAAVVSMVVDVGMPGLQQRAFLFLLLVWLSIVVHRLVRITAGPVGQPYERGA